MDRMDFDRIARHEWRIRLDGEVVGDVLRMPDVLRAWAAVTGGCPQIGAVPVERPMGSVRVER